MTIRPTTSEGVKSSQSQNDLAQSHQVEEKPHLLRRVWSLFSGLKGDHERHNQEFHKQISQLNGHFEERDTPTPSPPSLVRGRGVSLAPVVGSPDDPTALLQRRATLSIRPMTQVERNVDEPDELTPERRASLLSMFSSEGVFEMRRSLYRYLSGEEAPRVLFAESPSVEIATRRLYNTLSGYLLLAHVPRRMENHEAWVSRCLRGIALARKQIRERNFHGTGDKFVNALAGPVLNGIFEHSLFKDAALRTPEKGEGEHLARWKLVGEQELFRTKGGRGRLDQSSEGTRDEVPGFGSKKFSLETAEGVSVHGCLAWAQGQRETQEDAHAIGEVDVGGEKVKFFGIFDGHGGSHTALFLQSCIGDILKGQLELLRKPLRQATHDEIENILTDVPVMAQQKWMKIAQSTFVSISLFINGRERIDCVSRKENDSCVVSPPPSPVQENITVKGQLQIENQQIDFSVRFMRKRDEWEEIDQDTARQERKEIQFTKTLCDFTRLLLSQGFERLKKPFSTISNAEIQAVLLGVFDDWRSPGSTLTLSAIIESTEGAGIWIANVGDSRAIVIPGDTNKVVQVTEDATPDVLRFAQGATKRGGVIDDKDKQLIQILGPQKKVILTVARSVGNIDVVGMTARAKVQRFPIGRAPVRLIIGCDGLFDVLSPKVVADVVTRTIGSRLFDFLSSNAPPETKAKKISDIMAQSSQPELMGGLAEELVRAAYKKGSADNISVLAAEIIPPGVERHPLAPFKRDADKRRSLPPPKNSHVAGPAGKK